MFLRGVFIFCRVTENEPKEHVQKPTVSKDFPSLRAARKRRRAERPMRSDLHPQGLSDGVPDCLTAGRLGSCSARFMDDKVKLYGGVYPKTVVFLIILGLRKVEVWLLKREICENLKIIYYHSKFAKILSLYFILSHI